MINNVQWSRVSRQVYDQYIHHVTYECDRADIQHSSNWRNKYYDADLALISRRCKEFSTLQIQSLRACNINMASKTSVLPSISSPSVLQPSATMPLTGYGAPFFYEHPRNDTSNMFLTTFHDVRRIDPASCSVTESDFWSEGSPTSPHSVTEPSSQTTYDITVCPYCPNKTFEGKPENRRRNLRRHLFGEHSVDPRLSCPVHGCTTSFKPGRHDNLNRHLKQQHNMVLPSSSPVARKRKAQESLPQSAK